MITTNLSPVTVFICTSQDSDYIKPSINIYNNEYYVYIYICKKLEQGKTKIM